MWYISTMKDNKGQNIIEYILLVVAVILVFLVLLNPKSGPVKTSIETTLNSTVNMIDATNQDIQLP